MYIKRHMNSCCNCGHSVSSGSYQMIDGRFICRDCITGVVKTSQQLEWVKSKVLLILSKNGINDLPLNIPVKIVSTLELSKIQGKSQTNIMQLGLTITECRINFLGKEMKHHVYIIDGLHKVLFAGTLAHEYLHAWQNEHDIKLPPLYCEGFCNLGAYIMYQNIANELAYSLYTRMRDGHDLIYCEGFRQVKAIFDHEGKKSMISTMNILKSKYHNII